MKLDQDKGFMQHGTVLATSEFDIGNKSLIFEILRSKMYPNPIKAFTQEIMSNARDAHREVGKNDVPIEVQLPTRFDPCFYVRDFGPGISPERMENVFIKYGNSTKRKDNVQTGGFGLGAKSPWAYTDSFCISTYIPNDNGDMIQRDYIAVIGTNKIGELKLISEEKVEDEVQGTKITVACKPGDENSFRDWVRQATQFWGQDEVKDSVRPDVKAADFEWQEKPVLFTGERWFCSPKDQYKYNRADPIAVIDGIQYKLSWENLKMQDLDHTSRKVYERLFYHPVFMFFDTGDLPLAANREAIEYTPEAINTIHTCLGELIEELVKKVNDSIKDAKNLWEANLMFNKMRNNFSDIIISSEWQGIEITGKGPSIKQTGILFYQYSRGYRDNGKFRKDSVYYNKTFTVELTNLVLFNDESCKRPNRRRLTTIFNENKDIKCVTILQYPEDPQKKADTIKALADLKFNLWDIGNLSDYEKAVIVRNNSGSSSTVGNYTVPKIWSFTGSTYNKKDAWDSIEDQKEKIEKGEGVYVILFRRQPSLVKNKRCIGLPQLIDIKTILKKEIYGVSEKVVAKLGKGWISLEDSVFARIKEIENNSSLGEFNDAINVSHLCQNKLGSLWRLMKKDYKDISNGKLKDYFDWSKKYDDRKILIDNLDMLYHIYQTYINPYFGKSRKDSKKKGPDFSKMFVEVREAYPMIGEGLIDFYYGRWDSKSELKKDFYAYIKMCDMRVSDVGWQDDNEKDEKVA